MPHRAVLETREEPWAPVDAARPQVDLGGSGGEREGNAVRLGGPLDLPTYLGWVQYRPPKKR